MDAELQCEEATSTWRTADGAPLQYFGRKEVRLVSDEGEKLTVKFVVLIVTWPIISVSDSEQKGMETHYGMEEEGCKTSFL